MATTVEKTRTRANNFERLPQRESKSSRSKSKQTGEVIDWEEIKITESDTGTMEKQPPQEPPSFSVQLQNVVTYARSFFVELTPFELIQSYLNHHDKLPQVNVPLYVIQPPVQWIKIRDEDQILPSSFLQDIRVHMKNYDLARGTTQAGQSCIIAKYNRDYSPLAPVVTVFTAFLAGGGIQQEGAEPDSQQRHLVTALPPSKRPTLPSIYRKFPGLKEIVQKWNQEHPS